MTRILALVYGSLAYVAFVGTFLYAVAFVGDLSLVPKTIDSGVSGPLWEALVVDTLLLACFALQHSLMARPAFKRVWTRVVPHAIERSTYVLFASLVLVILFWQWRPMPAIAWSIHHPILVSLVWGIFWTGFGVVLLSSFLISHFELFGLQQVLLNWLDRPSAPPTFRTPLLYKHVRHPLYLGFLMAFWAAPTMTAGHVLFALATTAYIFIGIALEERDLVELFGDEYRRYRERVAMLVPWRKSTGRVA